MKNGLAQLEKIVLYSGNSSLNKERFLLLQLSIFKTEDSRDQE